MKISSFLLAIAATIVFIDQTNTISVPVERYDLIKLRCFNRSRTNGKELILGQNEPIGLSMENLISMIEKFEKLNPNYTPDNVIKIFLRRFHIDGVQFDGKNNIPIEKYRSQSKVIDAILSIDHHDTSFDHLFPENQFTEDEKCNLFFTLSHFINETAKANENISNIFIGNLPRSMERIQLLALNSAPIRDLGNEIPLEETTISSSSITANNNNNNNNNNQFGKLQTQKPIMKRNRREIRMTRKPREYGVVSFLSSEKDPISASRVLLGLYVGLVGTKPRKVIDVIKDLGKTPVENELNMKEIDPLLAVTLADIFSPASLYEENEPFGANGVWNNNVCHTEFILGDNKGLLGTMAELRGGLDGYNIGTMMESIRLTFPNITASQALRYYYTKQGLTSTASVCYRDSYMDNLLKDDLIDSVKKYLTIWNNFYFDGLHDKSRLDGYVNLFKDIFIKKLGESASHNEELKKLCFETITDDIRKRQCETISNAFFILDISQTCNQQQQNQNQQHCLKQATFVNELTKNMLMKRNYGSISILYNALPVENPSLIDDQMMPVNISLFSVSYNKTSSECASCKAIYGDTMAQRPIQNRVEMFDRLNRMLEQFDEIYWNRTAVPGKLLFWFDYGTLQSIPDDVVEKIRYNRFSRELIFRTRNSGFYSFATNQTTLNDVISVANNMIHINSNDNSSTIKLDDLNHLCQMSPQIFQYPQCKIQPSNNNVYRGFISRNRRQSWAMYSEYFIKSYHIEIRFRAEESKLKVCYGRTMFPENDENNCRVNQNLKDDIVLNINNPCQGMNTDKCPPFYFTITLYSPPDNHRFCTDADCQNIDQFAWYFSHTGISCNHANSLKISSSSSIFIIITAMFTFIMNKFFFLN